MQKDSPLSYEIDNFTKAVTAARQKQIQKHGDIPLPDGTGLRDVDRHLRDDSRQELQWAAIDGNLTWRHILKADVDKLFAEQDPRIVSEYLIEVAATIQAWYAQHRRSADSECMSAEPAEPIWDSPVETRESIKEPPRFRNQY